MPRNTSATLTEAELRLMNVLWQKGSATVHQVLEALPEKPALAYNSVLTTIRILEKKGYVKHAKDGRAHVYTASVERQDATRFEISHLVSRFFKNSHELLVLNILENDDIGADDLQRLRQLLDEKKVNLASMYFTTLAQSFSGQIVNCLVGGAVILLLVELFSRLLRREQSSARFALWFVGLIGIAGIPLLSGALGWAQVSPETITDGNGIARSIVLPGVWAVYLFTAWLTVAALGFLRIAAGLWQMYALRSRSSVLEISTLPPELHRTIEEFRRGRDVAILESDEIHSPTAIGLISPAILLPRWLKSELSADELHQIFVHELSHLRRWDDWSNLLQKILKALFFFHPAVWRIEKQISLEREMSCDEAVLSHTDNPRGYAKCLVHLAERSLLRRTMMLAQAAVSRVGQTSLRVTRILGGGRPRSTVVRMVVAPTFTVLLLVSLVSVDRLPQLVAFGPEEKAPEIAVAHIPPVGLPYVISASLTNAGTSARSGVKKPHSLLPTVAERGSRPALVPYHMQAEGLPVVEARLPINRGGHAGAVTQGIQPCQVLFVVMESGSSGSAVPVVWQIQMWQVTILRAVRNPAPQPAPQKIT